MARQTDDADVVGQVLAAELCTKTNLVRFLKELLFEVDVAESASRLMSWEQTL